jgi:hypothetical protein
VSCFHSAYGWDVADWAEIACASDREDDSATVFDSRDAFELEWARCVNLYEPPPSSPRGRSLRYARGSGLWVFLDIASRIRTAWQPDKTWVPCRERVARMKEAAVRSRDSVEQEMRLLDLIRDVPERTDDPDVMYLVRELENELVKKRRAAQNAARLVESLQARVLSDINFNEWKRSAAQIECAESVEGFVRLVFRRWGRPLARELGAQGMSRLWVNVAIATRLIPVPREHPPRTRGDWSGIRGRQRRTSEFRGRQATLRKYVRTEYERLFHERLDDALQWP